MRQKSKHFINKLLRPLGIKLTGLAIDKERRYRMNSLVEKNHFGKPVFPIPYKLSEIGVNSILEEVHTFREVFESFKDCSLNQVGYSFENDYYSSPDAEILYTFVRKFKPNKIIEVGSGNSTRISRLAINDAGLKTELTSIDPFPRIEMDELADVVLRSKLEDIDHDEVFKKLTRNDILFIDSSHIVNTGGDVTELFCKIIPELPSGVIVHIHDIFLPYEYPKEWLINNGWDMTEQYLVQVLLGAKERYQVIWPGYYLQKNFEGFDAAFPWSRKKSSQSFWIRII